MKNNFVEVFVWVHMCFCTGGLVEIGMHVVTWFGDVYNVLEMIGVEFLKVE